MYLRGGFNVFDEKNDNFRSYYGYGEEITVQLVDTNSAMMTTMTSLGLVSLTLVSLIAF